MKFIAMKIQSIKWTSDESLSILRDNLPVKRPTTSSIINRPSTGAGSIRTILNRQKVIKTIRSNFVALKIENNPRLNSPTKMRISRPANKGVSRGTNPPTSPPKRVARKASPAIDNLAPI
jgi:hypothetical protein